jgi:DNA polymerase I
MPQKVVLIDANSLLYRAFFALPPLTTARGEMTNGVYGFAIMLYKILEEEKPDFIAAAFDLPTPTFRHQEYAEYKGTRERAPDELIGQIKLTQELLEALRIPIFTAEGLEADDLLGILACRAAGEDRDALIVSGDLDTLQLVTDHVSALITRRGITDTVRYDPAGVMERFGLTPAQLPDYKSLRGDTSDNIPGVPGIGEKTAVALLQQFANLENLLDHLDQVKPARAAAALGVYADQARLSKRLATIASHEKLEVDWEALRLTEPDLPRLRELFTRLEFRGLMKKLPSSEPVPTDEVAALGAPRIVASTSQAEKAAVELAQCSRLTVVTVATPESPHTAELLGLLLAAEPDGEAAKAIAKQACPVEPYYVPARPELLRPFTALLADSHVHKTGHGLKETIILLRRQGIELAGTDFDIEIASYLANPLRKNHDLWEVAFDMLGTPIPELATPPVGLSLLDGDPNEVHAKNASLRAQRIRELHPLLADDLVKQNQAQLFDHVEMPLVAVLAQMEMEGVSIDAAYLQEFSTRLGEQITAAEKTIYILAGEEFVINSPKQLQHILYEKLQLRRGKRTKTGYSTDAATLAKLAEEFEIVTRILEYRELTKLKSTYVDALPRLVNARTGRIHPCFNQAVTATGRLSCSDPNLQNIPIRTELGREIRRAFIADNPAHKLLAADYSQIELRVLAHIAKDEALHEVFANNLDLHTATASEVFGVPDEAVTSEMRRLAKIINFAIPYGTSPEGLAKRMGVSTEEGRQYMARYFERFAGVARYIEEVVAYAQKHGEVVTLLGRRRPLPEINSPNFQVRELAERMAVNTPIQGTAADIMKLAMLAAAQALQEQKLETRLILQVHDELVFEGPADELATVAALAREAMENAYQLSVPLKVDIEQGSNWRDMEKIV